MGKVADAYKAYYEKLINSGEATLKEINEAAVKVLENSDQWGRGEQAAIDILSKATGITY